MKLKSLIATIALAAVAVGTDHGAKAAGNYEIIRIDANSGFARGFAFEISDNGVVAGVVADEEVTEERAFVWTATTGIQLIDYGGSFSTPVDVSPNGIAIGVGFTPGDEGAVGFVWTATDGVKEIQGIGGTFVFPADVNSSGVVVGEADTTSGEFHAFMWTAELGTVDLGTPGIASRVQVISENGTIILETDIESETGSRLVAILPNGDRIDIPKLGVEMFPRRINRNGSVAGGYDREDGTEGAFFWSLAAGLHEIAADVPLSFVNDLSETDIVVGSVLSDRFGPESGFKWTVAGGLVTIPSLGDDPTIPHAVNSSGLVAGVSRTSSGKNRAFAWTEAGGIVDLGALVPGGSSEARFVTESGLIAGSSDAKGNRIGAFTWTAATGMVELPSFGGDFTDVFEVNASGVFVGYSVSKEDGFDHAVMWTPVTAAFGPFEKLDLPPALNAVKAGKTIDVTFSLGGDHGLDIFGDGSPAMRTINCESGAPIDAPSPAVGAVSYNVSKGVYTYAWVTSSSWAGSCRELVLQLEGGGSQSVNFTFK